ncbi:hypothetical protein [Arthrobacter sp. TMS2-4]
MGTNADDFDDGKHQDGRIQILDLAADAPEKPSAHPRNGPAPSKRMRILMGGLVLVGLFGGLTLLPSPDDTPPPEEISPPIEALTACQALEQAEQDGAAGPESERGRSSARNPPSGYSLYGVMTSPDTTELVGLLHPDGSVEICEESARRAPFDVRFAAQADLGELPEGMTYAYKQSGGFSDNTLTMGLKGIRLSDGTVVESLTLSNGRTVPATPASEDKPTSEG